MASQAACLVEQERAGVMVASSNEKFRKKVLESLHFAPWLAEEAMGGADALAKLEARGCQAVLLDRWLPDLDVHEIVETIKSRHPRVDIFLLDSGTGQPVIPEQLALYPRARELFPVLQDPQEPPVEKQQTEVDSVSVRPRAEPLPGMIGASEKMARVSRLARLLAARDTAVLLAGETGTGKELVARAIHQLSPRVTHRFVVINCAAIPEALLEAELFGHARGAFTGAFQSRLGRIQAAHGGTLFLDEVAELPPTMQAKLLRFLQEGELQRLGSPDPVHVNVRVIAATNANLVQRVGEGRFRPDLYYRLSVFPIELPPLRERPEDIVPLATHYVGILGRLARVTGTSLHPSACRLLQQGSWPGNVRELQHAVERAFILAEGECILRPEHFSPSQQWG